MGNPGAQIDRSVRGNGDNLFTDSVVALDPGSGRRKWHFQFTPNDGHDWDSAQDVVLVDRMWRGQDRKLLLHADRNGMFYVLDRTDGKLSRRHAVRVSELEPGLDANGRPIQIPGSNSSPEGSFLCSRPWSAERIFRRLLTARSPECLYLAYSENGQQYTSAPAPYEAGRQYIGRGRGSAPVPQANDPPPSAGIKALDPETGKTMWDFKLFQSSLSNGVMATAGGVVFASSRDGYLIGLDAGTGKSCGGIKPAAI